MASPKRSGVRISRQMATLCRRHKVDVTARWVTTGAFDTETGEAEKTFSEAKIALAGAWAVSDTERFAYDISYLAANKNFTYGGEYQIGDLHLLIPGRHLPNLPDATNDTTFEIDSFKYKVVKSHEFLNKGGRYFYLRRVDSLRDIVQANRYDVVQVSEEHGS